MDDLHDIGAHDQIEASRRERATTIATHWRFLLDAGLPPLLAACLTRDFQAALTCGPPAPPYEGELDAGFG